MNHLWVQPWSHELLDVIISWWCCISNHIQTIKIKWWTFLQFFTHVTYASLLRSTCPSSSINWFIVTLMVNTAARFDYSWRLWTAIQMWTPTEPRNVLVVPRQSLLAAGVQSSSARHPPEGVNVGADVEVRSPQKAHSSKALFSCKHTQDITAGWAFHVELWYVWIVVLRLISRTLW